MCELEFISIPGAGTSLCGYLLAKLIIFCIFISLDFVYLCCAYDQIGRAHV